MLSIETLYAQVPLRLIEEKVMSVWKQRVFIMRGFALVLAVFFVGSCQTTNNTVVSNAFHQTDYLLISAYHDEKRARQDERNIRALTEGEIENVSHLQLLALPIRKPEAYMPTRGEVTASPELLRGLSQEAILAMIGEPSFRRVDRFGAQWQYRTRRCTLDLFLYDEVEQGENALVDHYDIRGDNDVSEQACLTHIINNGREVRRNQVAVIGR